MIWLDSDAYLVGQRRSISFRISAAQHIASAMALIVAALASHHHIEPASGLVGSRRPASQPSRVDFRTRDVQRGRLRFMLFMVIERFKHGDATLIGERFKRAGRMLPEGVAYHASWVDSSGTRCFQVMEASHPELMNLWGQSLG